MLVATENVAGDISLADWLEREGFEVMPAIDGREALQIAGEMSSAALSAATSTLCAPWVVPFSSISAEVCILAAWDLKAH